MSDSASYRAIRPVSVKASAIVLRGYRVVIDALNGTVSNAGGSVRGDYVMLEDCASGAWGLAALLTSGSVPLSFTATAITVGSLVYAAAGGQVSSNSSNALLGKCRTNSNGTLGEVELLTVA